METLLSLIKNYLSLTPQPSNYLLFLGVCLGSLAAYYITKNVLLNNLDRLVKKSTTKLDDILVGQQVFKRLAYIVPVLVMLNFVGLLGRGEIIGTRILNALVVWIVLITIGAILSSLGEFTRETEISRRLGLKTYIQVAKLVIYIFGAVVIISVLSGRSPWVMLSGLGALTAVLLLVFRDTILSFVASVQISSNNLVRIGDWIEMPQYNADGDVIDIALHTVKVQNWDKTISTIPTHKLLEGSIKNWRGMSQSGGRRIKRAVHIDMTTIRHCDEELLEQFAKIKYIAEYIEEKRTELDRHNREQNIATDDLINARLLTNIGTFRAYVKAYLQNHPQIRQDMTFMIRQLAPGSKGLPLEIYVFTKTTEWVEYEGIQSDLFDHILAIIPEFGLEVFQEPTGADFAMLGQD